MPIVVDHESGNPNASQALLQILLAKKAQQEQQQQEQQAAAPNIMERLAPILADRIRQVRGGSMAPEDGGGDGGNAGGYSRPSAPQPRYTRSAAYHDPGIAQAQQILGNVLGQSRDDQRYANQDALAQYRAQQQSERQATQDAQQTQMEAMRQADMMSRQQAGDVPDWIAKGLTDGSLRYSPKQSKDLQDANDAIDRLHNDKRWNPEQTAQMESRIRENIRQIKMSPQEVPVNERPKTPQQKAQEVSWEETDPVTGLTVRKFLGTRNGSPQPELDPVSQAHIDDWKDQQKFQRQKELEEIKQRNKPDPSIKEAFSHRNTLMGRRSTAMGNMHKAFDQVREAQAQLDKALHPPAPDPNSKAKVEIVDPERAQEMLQDAMNRYGMAQQDVERVDGEIAAIEHEQTGAAAASPATPPGDASAIAGQMGTSESTFDWPVIPPQQPAPPQGQSQQSVDPAKYDTKLSPQEEAQFQQWKQQYAPNDSGEDYDLRGAFKAGFKPDPQSGHWPDTYKKPNHPTFSNESIYAKDRPDLAGSWNGDTYVPAKGRSKSQSKEQPPMSNGRVLVNSEADIQRYNLQPGTPIVNSQGRTGTVR